LKKRRIIRNIGKYVGVRDEGELKDLRPTKKSTQSKKKEHYTNKVYHRVRRSI